MGTGGVMGRFGLVRGCVGGLHHQNCIFGRVRGLREGLLGPIWGLCTVVTTVRNRFLPFLPMVCIGFGEGCGGVMG